MLFQRGYFLLFPHREYLSCTLIFVLGVSDVIYSPFSAAGSGFEFCFVVKLFKRDILRNVLSEGSIKSCVLKCELKNNLNCLLFV